jgi:hypothetical protein
VSPFGVDTCSGLRAERKLDEEKLSEFMRAVRETMPTDSQAGAV